jgi:hypothetical protein
MANLSRGRGSAPSDLSLAQHWSWNPPKKGNVIIQGYATCYILTHMPHSKLKTSAAAGNDDDIVICYYRVVSFYGVDLFRLFLNFDPTASIGASFILSPFVFKT